jgi:hypothetical protein
MPGHAHFQAEIETAVISWWEFWCVHILPDRVVRTNDLCWVTVVAPTADITLIYEIY